jgi:molybdate transport repressor ModE-like protein
MVAKKIIETPKLTLRVDLGTGRALGPGKIRLLEAIDKTGSISQACRSLGMSYRRAWLLVNDINNCFREPVIEAQQGGAHGGGTILVHPSGIEGLIFGSWGYAIRREASLRRSSGRAWPWWR